jgi:flagellar basal-body rod protein FlgC
MFSVLSIATSGMQAASTRLDVAASNIANSQTTGPLPTTTGNSGSTSTSGFPSAYVPLAVNQVETSNGSGPSGTLATVVPVSPSFVPVSDPSAPFADQNGMVAAPNVDPANMLIQAAIAQYSFSANAKVATAADQMTKSLLDILS